MEGWTAQLKRSTFKELPEILGGIASNKAKRLIISELMELDGENLFTATPDVRTNKSETIREIREQLALFRPNLSPEIIRRIIDDVNAKERAQGELQTIFENQLYISTTRTAGDHPKSTDRGCPWQPGNPGDGSPKDAPGYLDLTPSRFPFFRSGNISDLYCDRRPFTILTNERSCWQGCSKVPKLLPKFTSCGPPTARLPNSQTRLPQNFAPSTHPYTTSHNRPEDIADREDKILSIRDCNRSAIKAAKTGHAPGPDSFTLDYYKKFRLILLRKLTQAFNALITNIQFHHQLLAATSNHPPEAGHAS
ncbi:Hypothetical predicted protein [Pelobates cultripes]|uniref:Uncharacterized protein n=1 Tax=Pelobates cultripes TaxID=61616 RepID=A0AAD1R586_PELCU|nr:Hypothetical predicted protein [Pelobates cultripes]